MRSSEKKKRQNNSVKANRRKSRRKKAETTRTKRFSTRMRTEMEKRLLGGCFNSHARLGAAYDFREKLTKLYRLRVTDAHSMIPFIDDWCESAEKTKITALRDFSVRLKSYSFLAESR